MNQPVLAGQRRAQASTIAQIKVNTAVMGAMVARRQQPIKMPRPDAYAAAAPAHLNIAGSHSENAGT